MIYIASPYSHKNQFVRSRRYKQVRDFQKALILQGINAISPVVMWHEITLVHDLPYDYKFWLNFNHELMNLCEELYVLKIDGWAESAGVAYEIDYFLKNNKQVNYKELTEYKKEISLESIWVLIQKYAEIDDDLTFNKRTQPYCEYRNLCIIIYKDLTKCKWLELTKLTGLHHATLINAYSRISGYIAIGYDNRKYEKLYQKIINELK